MFNILFGILIAVVILALMPKVAVKVFAWVDKGKTWLWNKIFTSIFKK
jgi:hypothetical protein